MTQTIQTAISKAREEEIRAQQDYDALVAEIARGREQDGEKTLAVLRRADRSFEQLEEDVRWRTERDEMIAEVTQVERLETEQKTLQNKIDKLYEKFKQTEETYLNEVSPLENRVRELRSRITGASGIRSRLAEQCRDENLIREMSDVRRRQAVTQDSIRDLNERTERNRRDLDRLEAESRDRSINLSRMLRGDALTEEIKSLRAKIRKSEKEIGFLEIDANELDRSEREIRSRMILA